MAKKAVKTPRRVPVTPKTASLQFHYIKGPNYREIVTHGAIGSVTPQKIVCMSLYSERGPIPRTVTFDVPVAKGSKTLIFDESSAQPTHIEARQGVIRHIETTTYMDVEVAERLHKWLGDRIAEIRKRPKK